MVVCGNSMDRRKSRFRHIHWGYKGITIYRFTLLDLKARLCNGAMPLLFGLNIMTTHSFKFSESFRPKIGLTLAQSTFINIDRKDCEKNRPLESMLFLYILHLQHYI